MPPLVWMTCAMFLTFHVVLTAAEDPQLLTKKIGEDVTFDLEAQELKYDDMVLWSRGPNNSVIYNIHIGKVKEINAVERFSLNLTTGSLTIHGLSSGDSDVYMGQIINGRGTKKRFRLIVVEPPTPEPPRSMEPWQIGVIVTLCILVMGFLAYAVKNRRKWCSEAHRSAAGYDLDAPLGQIIH